MFHHVTAHKTTASGFKIEIVQMKQTRCYMFNFEMLMREVSFLYSCSSQKSESVYLPKSLDHLF